MSPAELDLAVTAATALCHFAANADFAEFVKIYGDDQPASNTPHGHYLHGKFDIMREDLGRFIGQLDSLRRRAFVELSLKRYREKG